MTKTLKARFTALVVAVALVSPAMALDSAPMGTGKTRADLEKDGYKCELVATGFWECTKEGGTTYWCDAGSCQPKPLVKPPGRKLPKLNLDTKMLTK